jgi:hypothetical protein
MKKHSKYHNFKQDICGDSKVTPEQVSAASLAILCGMAKHKHRKEGWIYFEMTKVFGKAFHCTFIILNCLLRLSLTKVIFKHLKRSQVDSGLKNFC